MKQKNNGYTLLAALSLLAVFAGLILGVLLTGAGAYRRLTERSNQRFDTGACVQYLATKVHQAPNGAQADTFAQADALVIPQIYGDALYVTRVYCHDGWLMELFTPADGEFSPEDGERLIPAQTLTLSENGALLQVEITDETGKTQTLLLNREVLP